MPQTFIIWKSNSAFIIAYSCNKVFIQTFYSLISSTKKKYIFGFDPTNFSIAARPAFSSSYEPLIYFES